MDEVGKPRCHSRRHRARQCGRAQGSVARGLGSRLACRLRHRGASGVHHLDGAVPQLVDADRRAALPALGGLEARQLVHNLAHDRLVETGGGLDGGDAGGEALERVAVGRSWP